MVTATAPIEAMAAYECNFDYDFLPVGDLRVQTEDDPKTGKPVVTKVLVKDEPLNPTDRFWVSLYSRYGFNKAFMKYFSHQEVFERISQTEKNDRMRLCIERDAAGEGTLLGVSNPTKPIVVYDELMELLTRYHGEQVQYHNGIVESTHTPRSGGNTFDIVGDTFANRFMMATPVDGYGAPNIYLSLLRMICENGVVGYSKEFKSSLALGKGDDEVGPSLTRALDGFGSEEGYAAIRKRLEASATSWASVSEAQSLYTLLVRMTGRNEIEDIGPIVPSVAGKIKSLVERADDDGAAGTGSPVLKAYHALTGDTTKLYGLANLDSLSIKRKKTLPVKATVYEMVNFATEVASHYATPAGSRLLQGWVGGLVTEEYDLEGTRDKFGDFSDFLIDQKGLANLTGSANSAN